MRAGAARCRVERGGLQVLPGVIGAREQLDHPLQPFAFLDVRIDQRFIPRSCVRATA